MSNDNIPLPPSCDFSLFLCTLWVATTWRSVSDLYSYSYRLLWVSRYHCNIYYVPAQLSSSSLCEKLFIINIFFHVFHLAKPLQMYNIKHPTTYIFVTRVYPCIYDLYICKSCFLTVQHSLYICDLKFSLYYHFLPHLLFRRHQLHPAYYIYVIKYTCLLVPFLVYFHAQKNTRGLLYN